MTETRKIFPADGKFWMELYPHELELFKDHPEQVRWFDTVPTSEVTIEKSTNSTQGAIAPN